jgi:HD-like signal output (HDOD) protein
VEIPNKQAFSKNLYQTLQQTKVLPPLPETAHELLKLRNNPDASLSQLTRLIEKDPSLAAFIMKYARMPIYGYGDRVTSVHSAITLVLGFSTALNITIGIASAGFLKAPNQGPLGRIYIWNQALECAALCHELANTITKKQLIDSGLAYLSGLFHNFGYLLLAHLHPIQFNYLNDLVSRHQEEDVRALEMHAIGITHDTIGMYLIKAWDLPEEIAVAVGEHHFPDYSGKHAPYVQLIATANRLLNNKGMTDACHDLETPSLLKGLGISETDAEKALKKIQGCESEFNKLAQELAA